MGIWDEGFEEPDVQFPEHLLIDYIKTFQSATEGFADLSLLELDWRRKRLSPSTVLPKTFQFSLILGSNLVRGYSFEVLHFGYDITIYPVHIVVEDEIGDELNADSAFAGERFFLANNEEEFVKLIEMVFNSKKFRKVVGGLIRVAKEKGKEKAV